MNNEFKNNGSVGKHDLEKRVALADDEFEQYNFGEDVTVSAFEKWDKNDADDFTRIVYINGSDDGQDVDSERVSFHVRFNEDGSVGDAYGLLMKTGSDIGFRPSATNESPSDEETAGAVANYERQ